MNKRIKFWLIFILFYILAFFAWWTYSLVDLTTDKYSLLLKNEELRAKQSCMKVRQMLNSQDSTTYNIDRIKDFATKNCIGLKLVWDNEGKPDLVVKKQMRINNRKQLYHEKKKYLMEGVSMFLLIAAGVIWIFIRLGKILNLSKQQNNFLLSVSHELKTPLTAIQLSGQTLNYNFDKLPDDKKKDLLSKIDFNTNRLNNLIDQMLILTRIEGSQYQYEKQEINLNEIVNYVINNHTSNTQSPIKVKNNIPSNSFVIFDRLTLELCFSNIIENAIKYSPNGGDVIIQHEQKGKFHVIEVQDQGVGIPESEKTRIFEKFYRIGNEDTRTTKGTGLGLYLVKQILNKQKATIKVKDNQPTGSIFVIKLKVK